MHTLHLKNFKCFKDQKINFVPLTVLTGSNGGGKSSSIQSILLLHTAILRLHDLRCEKAEFNLELNGPYDLEMGTDDGLINFDNESDEMSVAWEDDDKTVAELKMTPNDTPSLFAKAECELFDKQCPIAQQEFYYLSAERLGPRIASPLKVQLFPHAGYSGEYSAQLLSDTDLRYRFNLDKQRMGQLGVKGRSLINAVNAWMDYVLPGVAVTAERDENLMVAQVKVENLYSKGHPTLPTNTGFGISYVLPIILDGLVAKKGSMLIVENPEAHLHPSAQSRIGQFLAVIAESGVNVVVETHSDHVLNGIQLAVAKNLKQGANAMVNFFQPANDDKKPEVKNIPFNDEGNLAQWPRGFFDQTLMDFSELRKLQKAKKDA